MSKLTTQRVRSPIVGSRFYAGALEALVHIKDGADVLLVREFDNRHDKNAVAVFAGKQQLGHVLAEVARTLAPLMDARGASEMLATFSCNSSGRATVAVNIERA